MALVYGACDYCNVYLEKDSTCIVIKDLQEKFLNIVFCSDDCCNSSKLKYPFLDKFTIGNKKCAEPVKPDINLITYLIEKFPSYIFKDYDDFVNGKVEKPSFHDTIKLLENIHILSSKKQISDKDIDFLNTCIAKNIV